MPATIQPLLAHLPAFAMVLFRIAGIFAFAPMFGSSAVPARIKILWALGLSLCVYPVLSPGILAPGAATAGFITSSDGTLDISLSTVGVAVGSEMLIGLILGLGASLPIMGVQLAGHTIDQQIGLGLASIFNPDLEEQTSPIGQFYFLMATAIFLILGGHRILLLTLLQSFDNVPLGGFRPGADAVTLMTGLLASMFDLCIRVAAPLLCLVFLETVAMGFIARTVPQFNLMSVGFPIRILIGIAIMSAAVTLHAHAFADAMRGTLGVMSDFMLSKGVSSP